MEKLVESLIVLTAIVLACVCVAVLWDFINHRRGT